MKNDHRCVSFWFEPVLRADPLLWIPQNSAHTPADTQLTRYSDTFRITAEILNPIPICGGTGVLGSLDPGTQMPCLARPMLLLICTCAGSRTSTLDPNPLSPHPNFSLTPQEF